MPAGPLGTNVKVRPSNPLATGPNPMTPRSFGPERYAGLNAPQPGGPANSDVNGIRQTLPYVPPPTSPLIQQLTGQQQAFTQQTGPLLEQILQAQAAPFGPEMELRQRLLDLILGQDNAALEQMLEARPRSGAFFFR